jgi:hypothetical protein
MATMAKTIDAHVWNFTAEQLQKGGPAAGAWRAALEVLGIPQPREQCNGSWRVPFWTPEQGWELTQVDGLEAAVRSTVSRSACGDPECIAVHLEEVVALTLAMTKRRLLAARARRRQAAAAGGVR